MRFLLVDSITQWQPGHSARAVKNIALSEDFFDDHFPLKPIFPGVLIIEGLAQLSGLLLEEGLFKEQGLRRKALMSMVERAKFRQPVYPGEQLVYESEIAQVNEMGGKVNARAVLRGGTAAECSLLFSFHVYENADQEAARTKILELWLQSCVPGDYKCPGS